MSNIDFSRRIAFRAGAFVVLSVATPAMAGCQSGSSENGTTTMVLDGAGCQAQAPGIGAMAIGNEARASSDFAIAAGTSARATAAAGSAFGTSARASGESSTAVGFAVGYHFPPNTAPGYTALGAYTGTEHLLGPYSTTIGAGTSDPAATPRALGDYAIAIGGGDGSNPFGKPLIGARSNYFLSIALGNASVADSDFAMAFGFNAKAGSGLGPIGPIAIGPDAQALADSSTALGRFAKASAPSSLAVGHGAVAHKARSVAIGSGSVANYADTVSVGTNTARRRIVNVAPGVANSDAPTLGQVKNIAAAAAVEVLSNATMPQAMASATSGDLEQELRAMRSIIKELQAEIAELKAQNTAALAR